MPARYQEPLAPNPVPPRPFRARPSPRPVLDQPQPEKAQEQDRVREWGGTGHRLGRSDLGRAQLDRILGPLGDGPGREPGAVGRVRRLHGGRLVGLYDGRVYDRGIGGLQCCFAGDSVITELKRTALGHGLAAGPTDLFDTHSASYLP